MVWRFCTCESIADFVTVTGNVITLNVDNDVYRSKTLMLVIYQRVGQKWAGPGGFKALKQGLKYAWSATGAGI